ncbi:MAG: cupin [Planctomycetia bacterium]|nr:cupin [Planctomycetia bacterium]
MPKLIERPIRFPQNDIKIDEFFGLISSGEPKISFSRIQCEGGWSEPAQRPEFDEYCVVLTGALYIRNEETGETTIVRENQAAFVPKNERIRYSAPEKTGADYFSVCIPAFEIELARRDRIEC